MLERFRQTRLLLNFWLAFASAMLLAGCARPLLLIPPFGPPPKKFVIVPEKPLEPTMRPYVVGGERYYPLSNAEGFVERGVASWYGPPFHGRRTSNGEIYNMDAMTAAHKTLPMGTQVRVLNLQNGKETVVRINDRGPFVPGRVIDLSREAARRIDLVGPGTCEAEIAVLGKEVLTWRSPFGDRLMVEIRDPRKGSFTVQIGAFRDENNARRMAERLRNEYEYVEVAPLEAHPDGPLYRVRVFRSDDLSKAEQVGEELKKNGFTDAFVVAL